MRFTTSTAGRCKRKSSVSVNYGIIEGTLGSGGERVQKCATDLTGLGVEPIVAGWLRCAACVKTIRGAMSDACMGVTRLWKAAKSQYFRTPTQDANSIFVDEGFMRGLLVQREKADAKLLEKVECNNHLAANVRKAGSLICTTCRELQRQFAGMSRCD